MGERKGEGMGLVFNEFIARWIIYKIKRMNTINDRFKSYYSTLWKDFVDKIIDVDVVNCPEPHLPVFGEHYEDSLLKIAFVGIDTIDACSLHKYNNPEGYIDIIEEWQEEFNSLNYSNWAWRYNFWRFIFHFLSKTYNKEIEQLKNAGSNDVQRILKSFIWSNTCSVERYEVTAHTNGVRKETWEKIKDASSCFDNAKHILEVLNPDVFILLNWSTNEPEKWLPSKLDKIKVFDNVPLEHWHINGSNKHLFWTRHPRTLTKIGFDAVIDEILLTLKNNGVSFPGESRYVSIEALIAHIEIIATELNLDLVIAPIQIGNKDSYFYFSKPEWDVAVGYGFDSSSCRDFFYGIVKKEPSQKIPTVVLTSIQEQIGISDGAETANWIWWKWHEYRNWDNQVFTNINNGEFSKQIKAQVKNITKAVVHN